MFKAMAKTYCGP